MKARVSLVASLIAAFALVACSQKPAAGNGGPGVTTKDEGPALPIDHPPVNVPTAIASAVPQRLSVKQLRGTWPIVLGNELDGGAITWRTSSNGPDALDQYGDTLGEADYVYVTSDNLEPSPLYLKFMDDAARDVCNRVLNADFGRPNMQDRQFLRFVELTDTVQTNAAGFDSNLRYLKLRLYGIKVDPTDDAQISGLRDLFSSVVSQNGDGGTVRQSDVKEGWRAVCVAMLMAPEFHFY